MLLVNIIDSAYVMHCITDTDKSLICIMVMMVYHSLVCWRCMTFGVILCCVAALRALKI